MRKSEKIKENSDDSPTRVINLVISIERIADESSEDPFLIGLKERAENVQNRYENRQLTTQETIAELINDLERDNERRKEQARKGFNGLEFFIFKLLLDAKITEVDADKATSKIKEAFLEFPNWTNSENELRELRKKVSFAIFAVEDDMDKVTELVEDLFNQLFKAYKI